MSVFLDDLKRFHCFCLFLQLNVWVDDDDDHWFENGDSFETKVCFFALRRGEKKMM